MEGVKFTLLKPSIPLSPPLYFTLTNGKGG